MNFIYVRATFFVGSRHNCTYPRRSNHELFSLAIIIKRAALDVIRSNVGGLREF